MRKLSVFMLMLVFIFVFVGPTYAQVGNFSGEHDDELTRAMWVWDFDSSVSTEQNRSELLQFSEQHQINLFFVNTGGVLPKHPGEYEALIRDAHKKGIRVYGLDGAPTWALEPNHHIALESIQQVLDYNKAHPKARFDGFQHDIEPYGMPDFFNNVQSYGSQYLDLLKKCENLVKQQKGMKFDVAIPFWYATAEPKPVSLTYHGVEKPLDHHILDIVDSVSIMAYRNSAETQISVSEHDVNYAASVGKKAYVGAETTPPDGTGIPEFITYYNKGTKYMESQFEIVDKHFKDNPGYGGIAIERYNTYRKMTK